MVLAFFLAALAASTLAFPSPLCTQFIKRFNVTSQNYDLRDGTALNKTITVSGSFDISLKYCEPTTRNSSRSQTLLLLAHGATYNSIYWDFPFKPNNYSFVRFMAAQGYPTLLVDRLGMLTFNFLDGY